MKLQPKWPRFSLKALFALVAIVAAYIGGWEHGRMKQEMELKRAIRLSEDMQLDVRNLALQIRRERSFRHEAELEARHLGWELLRERDQIKNRPAERPRGTGTPHCLPWQRPRSIECGRG
jgi:hypothetical protein